MISNQSMRISAAFSLLAIGGLLTGCGLGAGITTVAPTTAEGRQVSGSVHGGQQPIAGATLQLYAAGNTGYGSSYTYSSGSSLLGTNVVTSDTNGNFNLTGTYTCPSASTPVYLVATGGNPGLGGNQTNANLALMAALGPCGQLTANTFLTVNEITTVASVWALSPFMTGIAKVGTSTANAQGLTNAFASVNKLVNIGTGAVSGPALPASATLPVGKINSLADVLAVCVNSAGGTAGDSGSACGSLFTATTVNGVAPTDTIAAAMNMAQNPTSQVSTIMNMAVPSSPFQPTYSGTATDLSLVISYAGGGLSTPRGVAVDGSGNVWVANAGANTVTETDNTGAPLSGPSGYVVGSLSMPSAIAIDQSGNAWVANMGNSTVSKIVAGGTSATVYSGGSLNAPSSLAIDAYGYVWATNSGSTSATRITPAGALANFSASGITGPVGVALDPK